MLAPNLRELFIEISSNYLQAKKEYFKEHSIAKLIREAPKYLKSCLSTNGDLFIEASAGKGKWAQVPWVAIIDKNETDGAQEGVYIVYLFSEDMKRLYLTFNQGVTKPVKNDGRKKAFQKLRAKAIDIQTNFPLEGFQADQNIKLAKSGLGSDYEKSTIYYKEYKTDNLPEDNALVNDLRKITSFYRHFLSESNVLTEGTDFSTYTGKVEEGKRVLKKHYVRERSKKVIEIAKAQEIERSGGLKCEICGFSFADHYGERGQNFIEGHHKKPVAEMKEGQKTSPEDIALVCSNCHRIIHRKMPWLSVEDIKAIFH